jgi:hypothetical protein
MEWLDSRVGATVDLDDIKCPYGSEVCKTTFDYEMVWIYSDSDVFARYDRLKIQEFLRNEPNFRYCIAPECAYGQLHDTADGNVFIYGECGHRHCTTHNIAFHDNETYEAYDERMRPFKLPQVEQEKLSGEEIENKTKKCPNEECGARYQKRSGCDHMACKYI